MKNGIFSQWTTTISSLESMLSQWSSTLALWSRLAHLMHIKQSFLVVRILGVPSQNGLMLFLCLSSSSFLSCFAFLQLVFSVDFSNFSYLFQIRTLPFYFSYILHKSFSNSNWKFPHELNFFKTEYNGFRRIAKYWKRFQKFLEQDSFVIKVRGTIYSLAFEKIYDKE